MERMALVKAHCCRAKYRQDARSEKSGYRWCSLRVLVNLFAILISSL